eukprot:TRINITY_DN1637_c0_g2_i2.p1 TRINITY_DN1637_c0_g2~~TRINITY_DN1637_c0_g2_i2.p1  ORF type:complete len:215 (+),score=83.17 TRINITY_DN1637_c0_g2_i2:67-711(+)
MLAEKFKAVGTFVKENPLGIAGSIFGGLVRLIPHQPNVTPLTALGLFSGARLNLIPACILSLAMMIVSDLIIGGMQINASWNTNHAFVAFGAWTPFVYGCVLIDIFLGRSLRYSEHPGWIGLGSLAGSIQFFIITNFGVWLTGYPLTGAGFVECYTKAIPFFYYQILGDFAYTAIFFTFHHVMSQRDAFMSENVNVRKAKDTEMLPLVGQEESM